MMRRLLWRHTPRPYFLFDYGMVFRLTMQFTVGAETIKARVSDVSDGGDVPVQVKRNDGCRHRGELRLFKRHTVYGVVGALNRNLHQVFYVSAVNLMTKGFVQNFNRRLRGDFASLRAANAVGDCEDATLGV
jgi:hypothetical protein